MGCFVSCETSFIGNSSLLAQLSRHLLIIAVHTKSTRIDSAFVYSGALRRRPTLLARCQGTQDTVGVAVGSIKQLTDLKRTLLRVELQSQQERHRIEVKRQA